MHLSSPGLTCPAPGLTWPHLSSSLFTCRCHLIKKWIKKCDDDSETSNWISANTKECPKCGATIEKVIFALSSRLSAPCSLLPAPCSLLPAL